MTDKIANENNRRLLERYLLICKNKGLTNESLKAFRIDIQLFLRYIEDKDASKVTHIDVEDFFAYCQTERSNGDEAMSRKYTSLNCFFNNMIKREYLDMRNPLDRIDKPKVRKKTRGHLTEEEMNQVFDYLKSINDLRGLALFSLFYSSGIRLSEMHQLNRDSLDFINKRFQVLGKGQKERICIFSDFAKECINNYLDSRDDDLESLFVSREHNRWSKKSIQEHVKKICYRAGIKKNISPHKLRHTTAMTLLKKDIPLDKIQIVLGHSNVGTTQIYAYNNIDDVQSLVDGLI